MIQDTKAKYITLAIFFIWGLLAIVCLLTSCRTSHVEQFHGDKDSVYYFRHGSVEWKYKQ